jgi:hypothetical protein
VVRERQSRRDRRRPGARRRALAHVHDRTARRPARAARQSGRAPPRARGPTTRARCRAGRGCGSRRFLAPRELGHAEPHAPRRSRITRAARTGRRVRRAHRVAGVRSPVRAGPSPAARALSHLLAARVALSRAGHPGGRDRRPSALELPVRDARIGAGGRGRFPEEPEIAGPRHAPNRRPETTGAATCACTRAASTRSSIPRSTSRPCRARHRLPLPPERTGLLLDHRGRSALGSRARKRGSSQRRSRTTASSSPAARLTSSTLT